MIFENFNRLGKKIKILSGNHFIFVHIFQMRLYHNKNNKRNIFKHNLLSCETESIHWKIKASISQKFLNFTFKKKPEDNKQPV